MTKLLVLYYSSYGHVEQMAYAQAEGARRVAGVHTDVKRVVELVPPDIETQHREFLKVHLRGGQPCPRCGRELRQIGGHEATTFCRTCQPPF